VKDDKEKMEAMKKEELEKQADIVIEKMEAAKKRKVKEDHEPELEPTPIPVEEIPIDDKEVQRHRTYDDVMLDIESFGNGRNACMVQIGAIYFDRLTGDNGKKIKINFDAREMQRMGADLDADTVYWWLLQNPEAQRSVCDNPRSDIRAALLELDQFLKHAQMIWSHASFDFPIVQETFKRAALKPTFPFRASRDIRTLLDLAGTDYKAIKREGVHHDALGDCEHQIKYCVPAFVALQKK
jgi:hypothetical protein